MSAGAAVVLSLAAGYGTYCLYTALALGWRGLGIAPAAQSRGGRRDRVGEWLAQAGMADLRAGDVAAVTVLLAVVGAGAGYAVFGGPLASATAGAVGAVVPLLTARTRRAQHRSAGREAWPRMIEELRVLTTAVGRSIPQALFEVGRRAPAVMRPAFDAAQREWLLSTDFERTLAVLKVRLADATADSVCETLLIAHEVGGSDIDRRLAALVEDRIVDLEGRKDAAAKQAGAKFARAFVVVVPLGMAGVGLTIGEGRAAYASSSGQLVVVTAIALIAVCWGWAGRLLRLPEAERVFYDSDAPRRRP